MKEFKYAKNFRGVARFLHSMFPDLSNVLRWAGMNYSGVEYVSVAVLYGFTVGSWSTGITLVGLMITGLLDLTNLLISFGAGFTLFWIVFFLKMRAPYVKAKSRSKSFDKNLGFAIRELYVMVNAGQTLFKAVSKVAFANYGEVSEEFRKYVYDLQSGKSELDALEDMSDRVSSEQFRKLLWQLINSLKEGADISQTLKGMVESIERSKRNAIEEFGSRLTSFSLMYLILAIVLPTLGMTVVIILSSLLGRPSLARIFYAIPVYICLVNVFFVIPVKELRPYV